jgi:hypothetical protein
LRFCWGNAFSRKLMDRNAKLQTWSECQLPLLTSRTKSNEFARDCDTLQNRQEKIFLSDFRSRG